jgi:hypothetical protein
MNKIEVQYRNTSLFAFAKEVRNEGRRLTAQGRWRHV